MPAVRLPRILLLACLTALLLSFAPAAAHAQNGTASGRVTNATTSANLSGIQIFFYDSTGASVGSGVSIADGTYSVSLAAGTYFARTGEYNAYMAELYNNIACANCNVLSGTPITITSGATTANINFALSPGATISGQVLDANTAAPIAGISVGLYNALGTNLRTATTTGAGAQYSFVSLPPGTYYARTLVSGGQNYVDKIYNGQTCPISCSVFSGTPIVLTQGATNSAVNFALAPGGSVSGNISGSGPLNGAQVSIYNQSGAQLRLATADASGNYSLTGLEPGTYFLRTFVTGSQNFANELYNDFSCVPSCTVTSGTPVFVLAGATQPVNFVLAAGGAIAGTVTDAVSSAGLNLINVQIYTAAGVFVKAVQTDATGAYTASQLAAGSYYVKTNAAPSHVDELYNNIACVVSCNILTGAAVVVNAGATTSGINLALTPGGGISGTVTESGTGNPISGISMQLLSSTGTVLRTVSTGGLGTFTFGGLPTASYYVRTNLTNAQNLLHEVYNNVQCIPACTSTAGTLIPVTAGSTVSNVNFALAVGGAIGGRVTDAVTGAGLAEPIEVYSQTGTFVRSVTAGATGSYQINGLPTGFYYLRATPAGATNHMDLVYGGTPCQGCSVLSGTPVAVDEGLLTPNINFAMAAGGVLSGVVTDEATGAVLPNMEIRIANSLGTVVRTSGTGSAGGWFVSGLPPGTYFARAVSNANSQNYLSEQYNGINCSLGCTATAGTALAVTTGSSTANINFTLTPGGSIAGVVTEAGTGVPLVGVSVQAFNTAGTSARTAITDATGAYVLSSLAAGTYYVKTTAAPLNFVDEAWDNIPCNACSVTSSTPITVTVGATVSNIDLALSAGGSVAGVVTAESSGLPVTGVAIWVFTPAGNFIRQAVANGAGEYLLTGLATGTYVARTNVQFGLNYGNEWYSNVPCLAPCLAQAGTPFTVTAGATTSGINFALPLGGAITGTVTDVGTGLPIPNLTVQIQSAAGANLATGVTNTQGAYVVLGLPTGSYYVRTAVAGTLNYVDEAYNDLPCLGCLNGSGTLVNVTAGIVTSNINFALVSGGSLTGAITDESNGTPIGGITVQVFTSTGVFVRQAVSVGGTGAYAVPGLGTGSYIIRAIGAGAYGDETYNNLPVIFGTVSNGTPVAVTAGNITVINMALAAGATISGTIRDAGTSAPLGGSLFSVRLYESSGNFSRTAVADLNGTYSFSNLSPGTYFARTSNGQGYQNVLHNGQPCVGACNVTAGTPIVLVAGANISGLNFALPAGGRVSGTVTNSSNGLPLSVGIALHDATGLVVATGFSDSVTGAYTTAPAVPSGSYYARTFTNPGFVTEYYNNQPLCTPNCTVTSGAPITVTSGAITSGIDFALAPATELVQNGDFTNGISNWLLFATPTMNYMQWQMAGAGSFQFSRVPPPPGTTNQALIFQNTGAPLGANVPILASFSLQNTAPTRKRISVLIHDSDFSDLSVCTFWLTPGASNVFTMRTRTTKAWANATISFYAASTNNPFGVYQIDNVSLQSPAATVVERTDCMDPTVPPPPGGANGANLLVNGDFASGTLSPGWSTFGQIATQVNGGVAQLAKLAGTPAGVMLQATGQAIPANTIVTATFQLGNSSANRKRVTVILHDNSFADLSACTFWLAPNQPLSNYTYRAYTTQAWANATFSVYPATTTTAGDVSILFDNATLRATPGTAIVGAECVEPNSILPDAGPELLTRGRLTGSATTLGNAADGWLTQGFAWDLETTPAGGSVWRAVSDGTLERMETVDLRDVARANLTFVSWLTATAARARIDVSTDGVLWEPLAAISGSDGWAPVAVDLNPYLGEVIRLRFVLAGGGPDDVWRIGDVEVESGSTAPGAPAAPLASQATREAVGPARDVRKRRTGRRR